MSRNAGTMCNTALKWTIPLSLSLSSENVVGETEREKQMYNRRYQESSGLCPTWLSVNGLKEWRIPRYVALVSLIIIKSHSRGPA